MPTYTYQCKKCGKTRDVFHGMAEKPRIKCEQCGAACKRLLGMGAGLIFRGSGFYETDYKRGGGKQAAKAGQPSESKSESKSEAKSESTSEGKSETKSPGKAGDSKKSGSGS